MNYMAVMVKPIDDVFLKEHYFLLKNEQGNIVPWENLPQQMLVEINQYAKGYEPIPMQQDSYNRALTVATPYDFTVKDLLESYGINVTKFNPYNDSNLLHLANTSIVLDETLKLHSETRYPWGKLGLNYDIGNQVLYVLVDDNVCCEQALLNPINYYAEQLQPLWLQNITNYVQQAMMDFGSKNENNSFSSLCCGITELWLANAKALSLLHPELLVHQISPLHNSICSSAVTLIKDTIVLVYQTNGDIAPYSIDQIFEQARYWVHKYLMSQYM